MKRLTILLLLAMMTLTIMQAQMKRVYSSDKLSSNMLSCMTQDKAGYIWIGTEYGLNKFDGYRFTNYLHNEEDSTSIANNVIVSLLVRRNGEVLIGTNKGLQKYDNRTNSFINFKTPYGEKPRVSSIIEMKNGKILVGTEGYGLYTIDSKNMTMHTVNKVTKSNETHYFSSLYQDHYGQLWKNGHESYISRYSLKKGKLVSVKIYPTVCGTPIKFLSDKHGNMILICQHGIMKYDRRKDNLVNVELVTKGINLSDIVFNCGMTDCKGNIFIGSIGKGLFYISNGSNTLLPFDDSGNRIDLASADIRFIFQDKEENFWIGCNYKGLIYFSNEKAQFDTWSFSSQNIHIGSFVSHVCQGDNGDVWCSVQERIFKFDKFGRITPKGKTPAHTNTLYRDHKGNYWIGTDNSLYRYHPENNTWTLEKKLYGIMINCMTDDGQGTLYISIFSKGFCAYNTKNKSIRFYSMLDKDKGNGVLCNDWINNLFVDSSGLLWIGTSAGIACFSPREQSFKPYGWNSIITEKVGESFCENYDGNILIGTDAGLYLYDKKKREVDYFDHSEPLRNKIICGIIRDKKGDLWCSTPLGIWQYDRAKYRFMSYINGNGLTEREYYKCVYLKQSDGRIFFGTSDGLTTFMPEQIGKDTKRLNSIRLANLFIGGKAADCATLSNGETVTDNAVDESDHFRISYLDNTFSMEFSLLQYSNSENIRFEYRLNGSDNWISTDEGKNTIEFSHLQPGIYTLEVRACDNGIYSQIKTIHITITPPWYSSTTAYLVYICLFIGIFIFGLYIYNRRRHEELYEEKMRFLINATHDIRSPLTLILGPLNKLIRKGFDNETNEELNIIDRNAQRILHLVNQILDVRKIDKQQMHLRCEETSMTSYIGNIFKNFEYHAKESNIDFTFEHNEDDIKVWIDRINFDKVITNLLSNAFKYTHEGGNIKMTLTTGQDTNMTNVMRHYMEINIIDSGIGLQGTKTDKIFDRFYQGDNSRNIGIQGTGIGLNLCKMIVNLHHGIISAENRTDAKGSCFTVRIPLGNKHLKTEEMLIKEIQETDTSISTKKTSNNQRFKALVADDDNEIGAYISTELASYYRFHTCINGKEALSELLRNKYDIVISDVMMPEMDGFTLVKMIKSNPNISHIPVILLTSKSDIDNRLEGIEKGADAYLAKPFNMEELHLTVDNLIKNRQRLKGKFSGALRQEDKIENKQVDANDDLLMKRIMKSVNENLSNSDYSIEQLSIDAGISRAQLHRKLKEITGVSASDFVRNIRMEQAVKLLREKKINITQIAYTVGFTNEAHFSTVFRKHFGIPPSEYNRKNEENEEP
jgi:ligand-binding sensor domain-containing protein/DNA-binding response OmpR family regulator